MCNCKPYAVHRALGLSQSTSVFLVKLWKNKAKHQKQSLEPSANFMLPRGNHLHSLFWYLSPYFQIACYLCFPVGHYQLTSHLEDEDLPILHLPPPLPPVTYTYILFFFSSCLLFKLVTSTV